MLCDVPRPCIFIESSMSFWSFADTQALAPPALQAGWTDTDQDTHRQHCAATGAQSTFASGLGFGKMPLFTDRISIVVSVKAVQICTCFIFTNQSHQIWTLFLYFKILDYGLYLYLTNLERHRMLDRIRKDSSMKCKERQ